MMTYGIDSFIINFIKPTQEYIKGMESLVGFDGFDLDISQG